MKIKNNKSHNSMLRNSREIPKIDDNRPEFLTLFNTYHVFLDFS